MSHSAHTTAESVCRMRFCSSVLFGRLTGMSNTLLLAALIVVTTVVRKLHTQLSASAMTSTSGV